LGSDFGAADAVAAGASVGVLDVDGELAPPTSPTGAKSEFIVGTSLFDSAPGALPIAGRPTPIIVALRGFCAGRAGVDAADAADAAAGAAGAGSDFGAGTAGVPAAGVGAAGGLTIGGPIPIAVAGLFATGAGGPPARGVAPAGVAAAVPPGGVAPAGFAPGRLFGAIAPSGIVFAIGAFA
jgi:hypothetical protein